MFGLIESLAKATVGVVLTPVALAVDVVTLPVAAEGDKEAFGCTSKMLGSVGKNLSNAVEPK